MQQELRSWEEWDKSLKNFKWLFDLVPGASDIDICIHAHNKDSDHFLIIETKPPGHKLGVGQQIMYRALDKLPNVDVLYIWGPDHSDLYVFTGFAKGRGDKEFLRTLVKDWWLAHKEGSV